MILLCLSFYFSEVKDSACDYSVLNLKLKFPSGKFDSIFY